MSVTIFGEYFRPMPMWREVLYYTCMAVAVVLVCRNLYLAVQTARSPVDSEKADLIRRGSIRTYLFRAAKASSLCGLLLLLPVFL